MERTRKAGLVILCGNSHKDMTQRICERLGLPPAQCSVLHKPNRETVVEIKESVRGKEVFIVQTGTKNVNDDIMELLIMVYACKTSCAQSIIGVIPYLPYSKQSKMRGRGSIVSRLLADMLVKAGINHIITMDLHQKEIQGFYPIPVDNLRASPFLLQYIRESIPDYRNAVLVARNPDSVKRATSYAERLRLGIAVIHGEEKEMESERSDGRNSPPPASSSSIDDGRVYAIDFSPLPVMEAKAKPPMNVVGDVGGKIAIMVDDIIDNVEPYVAAANVLKERGAYKVYVMATHGLLSQNAPQLLQNSTIDEVVVANTVPHDIQKMHCHKIKTVDVSSIFTEAIRRIHNNESMSFLFQNITTND